MTKMLAKGYVHSGYKIRKTFTYCTNCFIPKYPIGDDCWSCSSCQDNGWYSGKGTTRHQISCAGGKCKKLVCEEKHALNTPNKFCDYCAKCCQKLKIDCDMCGEKMNKRYCNIHTGHRGASDFRCEETHCRKCCKTAHLCFICNGTNDERFKFDWKGTFHSSCLKGKGKLTCTMCDKSYSVKAFYDGWFNPVICKRCFPEAECSGCYRKVRDIGVHNFRKYDEALDCLICDKCKKKRNKGSGSWSRSRSGSELESGSELVSDSELIRLLNSAPEVLSVVTEMLNLKSDVTAPEVVSELTKMFS